MFRSCLHNYSGLRLLSKWQSSNIMFSTAADTVHLSEVNNTVGVLTLNRPRFMNTINRDMLTKIRATLNKWENTKSLVIIKSDNEKVFCAGADIRELASSPFDQQTKYLQDHNSLHYSIANYRVPYVALINGITMGFGAGLSVYGKYRVATEKTVFAMPETMIGYFANCGAGYFLPRLPGHLGMYLGLTGERLTGRDVYLAGLATHYCEYNRLGELEAGLLTCTNASQVEDVLSKFCREEKPTKSSLEKLLGNINKSFSGKSVEDIFENLERDNSDWSQVQLKHLRAVSPLGLKVTHWLIEAGRSLSLAECLQMEMRLGCRLLKSGDIVEGVRAKIVEKDNAPKWKHKSVKDITEADVLRFFRPFDDSKRELVL